MGDRYSRYSDGRLYSNVNSTTIVEVSEETDFGTPIAGVITLIANTCYIVRGDVTLTNELLVNVDGVSIIGNDRNVDCLHYTGTTFGIDINDASFTMRNLWLRCSGTGKILDAKNIDTADPTNNYQRTKVLEFVNVLIANTTNIFTIEGFELVDMQNVLVWYIADGTIGCQFQSVRHIEISSCEFYNWFEEGDSTNLDFYRQIEILDNSAVGVGNGVVNLSTSIIHPEITQDGLYIDPLSTTGFGTITSNTFTDTNLTTGQLANFSYDLQNTYIIQANQGVINGNASGTMSLTGNIVALDNSATNPIVFKGSNTAGGGGFTSPITFPIAVRVITSVADASFEYNSKIDATFYATVDCTVALTGTADVTVRMRQNGVVITSSVGVVSIKSGVAERLSFTIIGQTTIGDVFDIEVESSNGGDVTVSELTLNGFSI